jgi:hypothetical protein
MKLKNKIYTLLSVFTLVGLTHSLTLKDLNAALSAPASWTFKYTNEDFPGYKIRSTTSVITTPQYTRTADGAYYNYTNTSTIITGLTVTHTFNRSNTSWYNNAGSYVPSSSNVGSDNSVGSTLNKVFIQFDNQTSHDYEFILDTSSNAAYSKVFYLEINGISFDHTPRNNILNRLFVPAFSTFKYYSQLLNGSLYLDAWYLLDLGLSDSYDAGYDDGLDAGYDDGYSDGLNNNPNILLNGFQAMVGILVNFALMILNLDVFGVSLLGVFGVIAFFVGIIWFLKILRG